MMASEVLRSDSGSASAPPDVLLIEDQPDVAYMTRLVLEEEGYHVIWRDRGRDGITAAATLEPDVILLDLMLPDTDGWAVLHALKEDARTREIPVIIESAVTTGLSRDDRKLTQAVLQKPFNIDDLLSAVKGATGWSRPE
jgi:two-component system, cell cycle response regulator DivK